MKRELKKRDSKYWLKNNKDNLRINKIYGGCKVYSPKGNLMFLCAEKKANWYLNRTDKETGAPLAIKIKSINPIINFLMNIFNIKTKYLNIQLKFEPKDEGNKDDRYSLSLKENICVVTGSKNLEHLTKHHITPHCYRMFMPSKYKEGNSHDIVPITAEKHYEYERHADELKKIIAKKFNAPLDGNRTVDHKLFYAIKSAYAIKKHSEHIPEKDLKIHKEIIKNYTCQKRVTQKTIDKLVEIDYKEARKIKSHGEIVVEKLVLGGHDEIQEFVEMWRNHFLEYAKPKYMPNYWDVNRSAKRLTTKKEFQKTKSLLPIHPFC